MPFAIFGNFATFGHHANFAIFGHRADCRYLKTTISKIPPSLPEDRAKDYIKTAIDDYIRDRIQFADKVISGDAAKKINDGDVILTYARSHSVEMALIEVGALCNGLKFLRSLFGCRWEEAVEPSSVSSY